MDRLPLQDITADLRPEVRLLICCARTRLDAAHAERLKTLAYADIDWAYLTSLAAAHCLTPLLYWQLQAACPAEVPPPAIAQLRRYFEANARHNLSLTGELLKLLQLFQAHHIPAVPYKGPVLAAMLYGNLALRQFGDLDILVYPQDVSKTTGLLMAQGYELLEPSIEYHHHFVRSNGSPIHVEIHWRTTRRHFAWPLDPGYAWERLQPLALAGSEVRCFPAEDLLLLLCFHGAKHHWSRLSWICDVGELLRLHPALDWARVMEQARRLGGQRILYLGLFMAGQLLEAPLPASVEARLQADLIVRSLAAQAGAWLFSEDDIPFKRLEQYEFYLKTEGYWPARLAYWLHLTRLKVFPNERDRDFLPLPASLSCLYWLLRPIRLANEYGRSWARLAYLLNATAQDFRDA
ncbi:MAG: nucleotidyltransferase family protein [Anaerolineae bacterium]|nr:nucleotidyltransferase family protein [Anaerolineae bacterium]